MITYRCNHCRDELGSIIRITVEATGSDEPEHFCSITCLVEWAVTNRVDVPGLPTGAAPEPVPPAPERDSGGDREATAVADHPAATADRSESKMPAAGGTARRAQDAGERTCEICGRVGTRRYVKTDTGWRCSPTATACVGNQPEPVRKVGLTVPVSDEDFDRAAARWGCLDCAEGTCTRPAGHSSASDIPAKQFPTKVTPEPEPPAPRIPHSKSAEITARCQDCTRAFTLTGRVLRQAIDMHELKHGHIVQVVDREAAS